MSGAAPRNVADSIADAALVLGEFSPVRGDPRLAPWAARQGQLANRYDKSLWRVLLRAADNHTTLRQTWRELRALLEVEGDVAADIEAATVDLYGWLSASKRIAGVVALAM